MIPLFMIHSIKHSSCRYFVEPEHLQLTIKGFDSLILFAWQYRQVGLFYTIDFDSVRLE